MPNPAAVVRAAGVVLLRDGETGPQLLLVHRPIRSDWSLPKGKLDSGEHLIAAAVRECDEETGFTPILGAPLEAQAYSVQSKPKVVNYWVARVGTETGFAPDDEVDEVRWVTVAEAKDLLTYPGDIETVVRGTSLPRTVPLVVLRHTQATKRSDFKGEDDADRPLTGRGRSQSKQLVPLLDAFGITDVRSSPARRCEETVRRFARAVGVPVTSEPALAEKADTSTTERVAELALTSTPIVLCTHRPVLPEVLDAIASALGADERSEAWNPQLPPGGFIVLHRTFDPEPRIVAAERHTLAAAV